MGVILRGSSGGLNEPSLSGEGYDKHQLEGGYLLES